MGFTMRAGLTLCHSLKREVLKVSDTVAVSAGTGRIRNLGRKVLLSEFFVLYLTVFYLLVLVPFIPKVFHPYNLKNVLSNTWPLLVIAVGQTFVLITAGIDLSQTSIMALSSVMGAVIMTSNVDPILFDKSPLWGSFLSDSGGLLAGSGWAMPVGLLAMVLVGLLIGLWNGMSVAVFRMPPFIVTLVSQMLFSAVAIWLTKSENVRYLPESFSTLGRGSLGFIPYAAIVAVLLAASAHILMSKTMYGRRLYATGINPRAARISGVPTQKIIIAAYMISGFCAAVGGILYSARLEQGRPTLGNTLLLDIVGANVIGGISLAGGKGKVLWTVFGVVFFIFLSNTLNLLNLDFYFIDIVKGLIILIAAILDVVRTRLALRYSGGKA